MLGRTAPGHITPLTTYPATTPATPIPANEDQRLARLRELMVLDSAPEPVFDGLAQLASQVCGVPIALLSLIDAGRQWFKAEVGLPGVHETPRDVAFCAHAIMGDALFEVPDATQDTRFAANPLVTGAPDIRFYAGAPLLLPGGERIGTLCVIDRQARQLDPAQARTLQALARIATETLLMRRDLITRTLLVRSEYEQALAESERFVRQITDSLPVRMAYVDSAQRYRFVNLAHSQRFGRPRDDILGHTRHELTGEPNSPEVEQRVAGVLAGQPQHFEYDETNADGQPLRIESRLIPDTDAQGKVLGFYSTGIDVTDRNDAERALRELATIFDNTTDLVVQSDWRGNVLYMNPAARRICGLAADADVTQHHYAQFNTPATNQLFQDVITTAVQKDGVWLGETTIRVAGGRDLPVSHLVIAHRDPLGRVARYSAVMRDISAEVAAKRALQHQAECDPLTGLLNRAGFEARLDLGLHGGGGPGLALLYIDLDHFKPVNDRHGHPVGDQVLQMFAQRLGKLVRPTDAVARLGGDEFAVLLTNVRELANAQAVADKVIAAAHAPFDVGALRLQIGASVGVAHGADPATGGAGLLARADALLYQAKAAGRGRQA